ncbi:MAG: hypothetical protein AAFZ52_08745 [Bacteroidota bacterium]
MKYGIFCFLLVSLYACGGGEPTTAAATEPAPREEIAAAESAPSAPPITSLCALFSMADAQELLGCQTEPNSRSNNGDNRLACQYACSNPFSSLSLSLVWRADGKGQDVSDRDNNPALQKVNVAGADAAHFAAAQGRLMAAKGKYLLEMQLVPAKEAATLAAAAKILAEL